MMTENDYPFRASFVSKVPIDTAYVMKSLLEKFGNCEAKITIDTNQIETVTLIVR